jgi:hypothetical protein
MPVLTGLHAVAPAARWGKQMPIEFLHGRPLTPEDLEMIRREIESFDNIDVIDDEIRGMFFFVLSGRFIIDLEGPQAHMGVLLPIIAFPERKMRVRSSEVFRHLTRWMFAFTILVLWIESAVAESITVRVVSASPAKPVDGHSSIYVEVDHDSQRDLVQFTTARVGQDVEVRSEGRLLMKARLRTPLIVGMQIVDDFGSDDVESLASRVVLGGKLEISALGPQAR